MSAWYWADGTPPPPPEPHPSIFNGTDQRPHSRACGLRCQGHGTACSRDCPTCGGADTAPSPVQSGADAAPSIPPWRLPDGPQHPQTGPGWVMTSHGPIRRAKPPWDVPATP